ncbi:MAG: sulfite exporter TauE/SafE family protein [Desulfosalsimonadaceae bacterium]|nr:sulfite exporter TauE/SafE family protein [Desulfosalsimonadaceae bacterium]
MFSLWLTYILVGCVAGVLAGLLGVGGGLVIVPMLDICFTSQGLDHAFIMHLALGTSLASIVFTSVSSAWNHHKRGAVRWDVVRRVTPGILAGTFAGSCVASLMSTELLKIFFVIFLFYVSFQMFADKRPNPSREFPGRVGMACAGGVIGVVSSLVGIGGGSLSVPFMIWCNLAVHRAIGTSAAIGFPIAVAGALGYIYNGLHVSGLPEHTLGYVYLPALMGIVGASMLTAPLGVRLAHALPVSKLKRGFAILLLVMGLRMLFKLVF